MISLLERLFAAMKNPSTMMQMHVARTAVIITARVTTDTVSVESRNMAKLAVKFCGYVPLNGTGCSVGGELVREVF